MAYKNETITVHSPDGQLLTGKLNWQTASQYNWEGRDYIDVPYEFDGYGKIIPGADTIAPASFNLVLRQKGNNDLEGALRTVMINAEVVDVTGSTRVSNYQFYELLTGESGNIWIGDVHFAKVVPGYRSNITPAEFAAKKQDYLSGIKPNTGTVPRGTTGVNCHITLVVTYSGNCNYWDYELGGPVVQLCRHEKYVEECDDGYGGGYVGGGGGYGGGVGGVGGGGNYPPAPGGEFVDPDSGDPCAEAKVGAEKATEISKDEKFKDAIKDLKETAKDGKEHGYALGRDQNGNIKLSGRSDGNSITAGPFKPVDNRFGDIHTHPNNLVFSAGDVYGFMESALNNSNYTTRYLITKDGTVYGLIVTNTAAMKTFLKDYPEVPPPSGENYSPEFPNTIRDEIIEAKFLANGRSDVALALIFEKYNAGIALVRQNANGSFKRRNAKESKGEYGEKTYVASDCIE
ncbi:hypothetical protein ABDK00_003060 [Niabella insulamsoli]|uniref:hypothetical protein n=1 Tax=Niabella insulamsoli TaxID=3144874 RepID=UPI0031FBA7A4